MRILTLCGSTRPESINAKLIDIMPALVADAKFESFDLSTLPMYHPWLDRNPIPTEVIQFKYAIRQAHAIIISTPEYLANIPAVLKNAAEWLKSGGELSQKKVLPITFAPYAPRGEKAMQSLCWTLQALDALVLAQLSLYHTDFKNEDGRIIFKGPEENILEEALKLLL